MRGQGIETLGLRHSDGAWNGEVLKPRMSAVTCRWQEHSSVIEIHNWYLHHSSNIYLGDQILGIRTDLWVVCRGTAWICGTAMAHRPNTQRHRLRPFGDESPKTLCVGYKEPVGLNRSDIGRPVRFKENLFWPRPLGSEETNTPKHASPTDVSGDQGRMD